MKRRKVLKLARHVGCMLGAGFIGGIPWRILDSIPARQTAAEPRIHRVAAGAIQYGWCTSQPTVTLTKTVIF